MLEMLSDKEIMNEYCLKDLLRYNNKPRLKEESVAEHSFFVVLFCLKIIKKLNLSNKQIRKILTYAVLHDVSEIRTNDITHDVKSNYPEVDIALNKIEVDFYKKEWSEQEKLILEPDDLTRYIVKLADCYSVKQFALNEILLGNNYDWINNLLKDSDKRIECYIEKINYILQLID